MAAAGTTAKDAPGNAPAPITDQAWSARAARALAALLLAHSSEPYFLGADDCVHPNDGSPDWDGDHPPGTGYERICLLTETGRYCPACTGLVYDDPEPAGDEYVNAGDCLVRPLIESHMTRPAAAPATP